MSRYVYDAQRGVMVPATPKPEHLKGRLLSGGPFQALLMASGVVTDPFFAFVTLLMHGDGTNGQTTTVDSSSYARAITTSNSATLSTAQVKYGTASMAFDGTGNKAFTAAASADTQFGTGDFTVEYWIYTTSFSTGPYAISNRSGGSGGLGWYVFNNTGGGMLWGFDTAPNTISAGTLSTGVWQFVAFTRVSGVLYIFVDGVLQNAGGTAHTVNYTTVTRVLSVGRDNSSGNNTNGWIDDLRITKGVGRYTANFTPPTAAFPNS